MSARARPGTRHRLRPRGGRTRLLVVAVAAAAALAAPAGVGSAGTAPVGSGPGSHAGEAAGLVHAAADEDPEERDEADTTDDEPDSNDEPDPDDEPDTTGESGMSDGQAEAEEGEPGHATAVQLVAIGLLAAAIALHALIGDPRRQR